jgi:hypothetical protein
VTDLATATADTSALPPYQGQQVARTTISIRNAGGALQPLVVVGIHVALQHHVHPAADGQQLRVDAQPFAQAVTGAGTAATTPTPKRPGWRSTGWASGAAGRPRC